MKTTKPLIILFVIGLICQSFGPLSCDMGRLLVFGFILIYFFVTTPFKKKRAFSIPVFFVFSLLTARLNDTLGQLSALSAFLFVLALYSRWCGNSKGEHVISFLTSAVFTTVFFLYEYFPESWYAVEYFARLYSSICSFTYSRVLNLGPTSFGFFLLVSFVIFHCVIYLLDRNRSLFRLILSLIYLFLSSIAFAGINLFIASIISKYSLTVLRSDLYTQALFFIILALSTLFKRRVDLKPLPALPGERMYKYIIVCLVLFAGSLIFYTCSFLLSGPVDLKTIAFYKHGSLDWNTPRFGTYGQRSGGMFGLMPKYLKAVGFNTKTINIISPLTLADADVLVMVNLNKSLKRTELFTLWDFVKSGGGLLLLGDHTNLGGLMVNFNQILRDVPIKFAFDSVMPARYTWDYLMDVRPHSITNGFKKELARAWWVGASLKCTPPAEPLVIGKYCYSDQGYKNNAKQAYLGNRRFDYYERVNDVVLAAIAPYGKGEIMACGDTSAFHNTTFMTTHSFVVNVFNHLSNRQNPPDHIPGSVIKIVLVLSIAGLMLLSFAPVPNTVLPLMLIVFLYSTVSFSSYVERQKQISEIPFEHLSTAYIDYSHYERFDLMSWEDDSIGGLRNNLLRNGFTPFLLKEFDPEKLMKAEVLVVIAPTQPFTENEVIILKNFVKKGGKIILSVGWEEREASLPILKGFGLGIDKIPLAWCKDTYKDKTVQFHEAWPVVFDSDDDVKVICKPMGYPALVSKKSGKGEIVVIADSYFLLNETLEGSEKYSIPNMLLFRDLLVE